ncbi:hypothetical protein E2562_022567 [Oryza meyeriana var. granulata]|uniref:BTB domain-containing protein n=1 Tax=Oryza meyeriana var. granulata TaxID=110450 RepID=A0A6G1CI36_9ORYZ|nr:hypothetical protein E2562_022567 [Oryza meyeriana var. granulata]
MHCAIEVVKESKTGASMSRFITVPPPAICRHLEQLLESKQGSDVTFQVEQSEYGAHRVVLAARSPVFNAQFFGPMGNNGGGRQCIHDMKPAVFEAVLHFIYTYPDTLPPVIDAASGGSKEHQEWHAAADRFDLERMRLLCENALCETIDVTNAAAALQLADRHHCTQLKAFCMDYIASPSVLAAVMAIEGFRELKVVCPSLLIKILEKVGSCRLRDNRLTLQ